MTISELMSVMGQYGFSHLGKDMAAGRYRDYVLTMKAVKNGVIIYFSTQPGWDKNALKNANKDFKPYKFSVNLAGSNHLVAVLQKKQLMVNDFVFWTDFIIDTLSANGIFPETHCYICGGEMCDAARQHGIGYAAVHESCIRGAVENVQIQAARRTENGNYITGLVGALLGMLLGLLPNVLVAVFTDRIFALGFALIPIAIYYLYQKFGGKMDKFALILSVVLTLCSVYLFTIFTAAGYAAHDYGVSLFYAIARMSAYVFSPEGFGEATVSSLMYFLFAALGLWISWRRISVTNDSISKRAGNLVTNMIRLPQQ